MTNQRRNWVFKPALVRKPLNSGPWLASLWGMGKMTTFSALTLLTTSMVLLIVVGCGYRLGKSMRTLPGGYEQVSIPIFENATQEVAIEPHFTDSLIEEFETSKIAKVVSEAEAPVTLKGRILSLQMIREGVMTINENRKMPENTSLATQHRLRVKAELSLFRSSDKKVLWSGYFENEIVYQGPRIGTEFVNSVNANYNHSARRQKLAELASLMMREAHDRVTENF